MLRRIIVSNMNDHGSGKHGCGCGCGCGCGSLYQIQTILVVVNVDVKWIVVLNTSDRDGDEHWWGVGLLYQIQMILWGCRLRRDDGGVKKKGMVCWFFFFIYYRLMRSHVAPCDTHDHANLRNLRGSVKYYKWCSFAFSSMFYMFLFYWLLMFCLHNPLGYVVLFFYLLVSTFC